MTIYSMETIVPIGKYKGLSVGAIIKFNPAYIMWMKKELVWFVMDDATLTKAKEEFSKLQEYNINQQDAWAHGFGLAAKRSRRKRDFKMIEIEMEERRKAGIE